MKISNWNNYTYNIKRTHRHKVAYAIDEYKQFGYNTIDCITHDADKMFMYLLGLPHDTVVKIHRNISEHHVENDLPKNIKSMFIDMHCSGEKLDKPLSFREYFNKNKELQEIKGLRELSELRQFGEKVKINELRNLVNKATSSVAEFLKFGLQVLKRMEKRSGKLKVSMS